MKSNNLMKKVPLILFSFATIFTLSSCSFIFYVLDEIDPANDVSGSYSFNIETYDPDYLDKSFLNSLGSTFADDPLYEGGFELIWPYMRQKTPVQTTTLSLTSSGEYTLTKIFQLSTSSDTTWYYYNYIEFHGSYTNSGTLVTLGEVASVAFEANGGYFCTNYDSVYEYTETTDLSTTVIFNTLEYYVIDLWYGPYFTNCNQGNATQTITIGDYNWGGFTFADDGTSTL